MKHVHLRNIKLLDELMSFCYKYGAKKIDISIENKGDEVILVLNTHVDEIDPESLELANDLLKAPRCHEMEEYYWNLTGDDDTDTELTLVGMMTDEAHIDYDPITKLLHVKLARFI